MRIDELTPMTDPLELSDLIPTFDVSDATPTTQTKGATGQQVVDLVSTNLETVQSSTAFEENVSVKGPSPWVDVKAYGAVGDGVADDTTAITNAIAAAENAIVLFSPGTYKVDGDIPISVDNVKLVGHGAIIEQSDPDSYTFVFAGISNVVIEGFIFRTPGTSGIRNVIGFNVGDTAPVTNVLIQDNVFEDINNIGIGGIEATNLVIRKNRIALSSVGQHGIYIVDCDKVIIEENYITGPGAGSPTFPANTGIKLVGCSDAVANHNLVSTFIDNGIYISKQTGTNFPFRNVVTNNIIRNVTSSTGVGIAVADIDTMLISGNQLEGVGNIGIAAGGTDISISHNVLVDCATSGTNKRAIDAGGSTNLSIVGNFIENATNFTTGILINSTGNVVVSSNVIRGAGGGTGFNDSSTNGAFAGQFIGNQITGVATDISGTSNLRSNYTLFNEVDQFLIPNGQGNSEARPTLASTSDTDTGVNLGNDKIELVVGGTKRTRITTGAFTNRSDFLYGWTDGAVSGTFDTAVGRSASGVVEINNGTAGQLRDLRLRNLRATGLAVYANNAAAVAGGLVAGDFYRTGADPDPVMVVH